MKPERISSFFSLPTFVTAKQENKNIKKKRKKEIKEDKKNSKKQTKKQNIYYAGPVRSVYLTRCPSDPRTKIYLLYSPPAQLLLSS